MIKFDFCIESDENTSVSPFELGHLTITDDTTAISSKGKIPDQSMMIFISLTDLLDVIKKLASTKADASFIFASVDSSFSLSFNKIKDIVSIINEDKIIKCKIKELCESIYKNAVVFYKYYSYCLENNDCYDLRDSLEEFRVSLNVK